MNSRALKTLLLITVVLLAGCVGDGGGTPTATPTPDTSSVWGDRVSPDEVTLPPGASTDGIANVSDLLDAHGSVVRTQGYRLHYHRFQNGPEGYANVSYAVTSSIESEEALYRIRTEGGGSNGSARIVHRYHNGDTFYRNETVNGEHTYETNDQFTFETFHGSVDRRVRRALEATTFGNATAYRRNDTEYVEYEPTGYDFPEANRSVSGVFGSVVVRGDGLIVDLWIRVDTQTGSYVVEQWYESVGTVSVTRPAWVDTATEQS